MCLFTPDDPSKGIFLGNSVPLAGEGLDNVATEYAALATGGAQFNANNKFYRSPMPTNGKFTHARVTLSAAPDPGGADGYRFMLIWLWNDTAWTIDITGDK
ncbi:unnamed protein product, partial [marine sediment metagenome]